MSKKKIIFKYDLVCGSFANLLFKLACLLTYKKNLKTKEGKQSPSFLYKMY